MPADYSKTVNLPQTDFPMKANLPAREPDTLAFWENAGVFAKLLEKNRHGRKFILHDGPPYANGRIHTGHALNKILKDTIVKHACMDGCYSPYVAGWDCHGLPIEYQLFKDLKIDKRGIDKLEFRKKAREFASKFIEIQKQEFKRLGVWADWDNSYLTMSNRYEYSIIKAFGDLVEKGFIYRSKKPIHWCSTCETALAEAEVEYNDHTSPSVFVLFRVKQLPGGKPFDGSVLIWTTTPWTLPANVALAFHPEYDYVSVEFKSAAVTGTMILAEKLLESVAGKAGITERRITGRFKGRELEGIICTNPVTGRDSRGVLADFVSLEDGAGVVHIAPGHGMEDYSVGLKYKLQVLSPVDTRGRFTDEAGEFTGLKVFEANQHVVDKLQAHGSLLHSENISHSYPHCWRCRKPVIFRATEQWFLDVEHEDARAKLLAAAGSVTWVPQYMKNRMEGMIQTRPDWCLSRQRYWGVPIPVVYCTKCRAHLLDVKIIRKYEETAKTEGSDAWFARDIKDFIPAGTKCACGNDTFEREEDILDVWFDSGVSHEAVLKDPALDLAWPADVYLEGSDQHRGWFQTSLIPAVALYGKPPYRTVITHGFVVDNEGHKMSKSEGNVVAPQEITGKYGAEMLRLWACSANYSEDVRISKEIIDRLTETYRKIRNTLRFALGNISDFDPASDRVEYARLWELERWILHRLEELSSEVRQAYCEYQFHTAVSKINNFCVKDLSSFYFDICKDRLYTFGKKSEDRRSAQTAVYDILVTLLRLTAPVLSFTAEEAWQCLRRTPAGKGLAESVFLAGMPAGDKSRVSAELAAVWPRIMQVRDGVNAALEAKRKDGTVGSSLEAKVTLRTPDAKEKDFLDRYSAKNTKSSWQAVFIVSQAEIKLDEKAAALEADVSHADGVKCPRCWNWHTKEEVAAEDGLCARCDGAMKQ